MHGGRVCLARAGPLARGCARSRVRGRPVLQRPTVAMETAKKPGKKSPARGRASHARRARPPRACTRVCRPAQRVGACACSHTRAHACTGDRGACMRLHTRAALHLHAHACAPCTHMLAHVCSLLLQALLHVHCLAHPLTCMHTLGVHSLCSHTLARCSLGLHAHTRAPLVHTHRAQTCVFLVHAHICTRMWIRAQGACTRCTDTLRVHMHAPFVHTLAHARPFCAHANTYVLPVHAHACTHVCLP